LSTNKSQPLLSPQATLQAGGEHTWSEAWRRQCEAREWVRQYNEHQKQKGSKFAQMWWKQTKEHLLKTRGQAGLNTLIADMKKEWHEKGGKS
jgi:hypothetical protein